MNALNPQPTTAGPVQSGQGPQPWPDAHRAARLVRRLTMLHLGLLAAMLVLLLLPGAVPKGLKADGLGGIVVASVMLPLAGLLATGLLARARARLGQALPPAALARGLAGRFGRLLRLRRQRPAYDAVERLAWSGRRPQGVIVPVLAVAAVAALWSMRASVVDQAAPAMLLGSAAIVLTFPLLVGERILASMSRSTLPEVQGLQALLFIPVLLIPLAGLVELLVGFGFAWAQAGMTLLAAYLTLVATELALRALANWFLPAAAAVDSRAAVNSLAALLIQPRRLAPDGLASPIREHLGIDFSRSWSLRYLRAATLPVVAGLAMVAWALTGVSIVSLDQRGVYERMGAPVAVWPPGIHVGLPWPLGQVRRVDLGVVHAILLGGSPAAAGLDRTAAEDPAPAAADRLWESEHPSEVSYLLASLDTAGGQSFQSVSVDARVLYRTGLDDTSALKAAYAIAAPDDLVRALAGRRLARLFASQVLEAVLGDNRETIADALRVDLQAELDRLGGGIELVAVVIEAIHPPAGAAEAYHNVQAAEIVANTAIAVERGRAVTAASFARQRTADMVDGAVGMAADTVADARVAARVFTADQQAAAAGGDAFLLERYFANLSHALAKSPLVIVDHRLTGADAPVIDLRAFGAPPARSGDED